MLEDVGCIFYDFIEIILIDIEVNVDVDVNDGVWGVVIWEDFDF